MPRAFLVKRKSQFDVAFTGDIMPARIPIKVSNVCSVINQSSLYMPTEVFDLHEVEIFNKCHSQFHQRHLSTDYLPGVRHLEYNKSICEQVNYIKEETIDKPCHDYPDNFSDHLEEGKDSAQTDSSLNRLEFEEMEPRYNSNDISSEENYATNSIKETNNSNHVLKTRRTSIPPAYVSEILAEQRQKILAKHVVNIKSGFFDLKKVSRRGRNNARQPIAGLEYIQNGTDLLYRNTTLSQSNNLTESSSPEGVKTTDGETVESDGKQNQQRKYVCDICHKGFSRSNTLVTHKRIHTGAKPFECEVCGRAFRQPGNLTRHRLIHTTVKPYKCSQCGKAFNRASNLHTHMRTHTNYKPFVCQYCGKGFHQKIDMKIHSYTHTGEKPHKCKKCGRGFKQLTHLTYHMRTHSDVKMYTCAYCGKGFNQKGNLQAHIYGHTGERPYRCELCGKGFTLASTLNTHRRTHTNRLAIPRFSAKTLPFGAMHLVPTNVE